MTKVAGSKVRVKKHYIVDTQFVAFLRNDNTTVEPVLSSHSKEDQRLVFKTYYRLMQVKRIAECSLEHSAILLTCVKLPS